MNVVCRLTSLALLLASPGLSLALPISPLLAISGNVSLDNSVTEPTTVYSGTLYSDTETTSFSEAGIVGSNPVMTDITEVGQGLGHTLSMSNSQVSEDFIAIDYFFSLTNNSADDYSFDFSVDFWNRVDADGLNAFADSEFVVDDADLVELFFTDIISDPVFGDQEAGTSLPTFGALLEETGTAAFSLTLAAGASTSFSATLLADAGVFDIDSSYLLNMDGFIYLSDVNNLTGPTDPPSSVPEPGSLALMLAGLTLLFRRSLTDKRN